MASLPHKGFLLNSTSWMCYWHPRNQTISFPENALACDDKRFGWSSWSVSVSTESAIMWRRDPNRTPSKRAHTCATAGDMSIRWVGNSSTTSAITGNRKIWQELYCEIESFWLHGMFYSSIHQLIWCQSSQRNVCYWQAELLQSCVKPPVYKYR